MSAHNPICIPGVANGTVSKGQFLEYASGGWTACNAQGEHSDGVAFNDAAAGEALTVQIGGLVKYKVGAVAVADGAKITTTAAGLGELAATGDFARLKAHGAGAAGAYATGIWFNANAAEA